MAYEAYPLIVNTFSFDISGVCDETCYLDGITPYSLEIQVIDAEFYLTNIIAYQNLSENADSLQALSKSQCEATKVLNMNNYIQENNMLWFANSTSISELNYATKKEIYGNKYNQKGFDYYFGGIFSYSPNPDGPDNTSNLIKNWDWRERHGANDPTKGTPLDYYYDNDESGSGWMEAVDNQLEHEDCLGLCYIYAPLSTVEAVANLYFNTHKFYDLSEQNVLDCDILVGGGCDGGPTIRTFDYLLNHGVVNESCYGPDNSEEECREYPFPDGPLEYRIKLTQDPQSTSSDLNSIKISIINHGPLCIHTDLPNGSHFMTLLGWKTLQLNDTITPPDTYEPIIIEEGSEFIGKLCWIYKNSWGINHGDQGYLYLLASEFQPNGITYIVPPIDDITTTDDNIVCRDADKDGYYNWGISELPPDDCPAADPNNRDSDDSENRIGPFDENYYGIPVKPEVRLSRIVGGMEEYKIDQKGVHVFGNDLQELTFELKNTGTAQLNLPQMAEERIEISGPDANRFTVSKNPYPMIKHENSSEFKIEFQQGNAPPYIADVTIVFEEDDIPNFTFTLIQSYCNAAGTPTYILQDTEWNSSNIIFDDVYVSNNATLTITKTIGFVETANLIIAQWAKVVLDGGCLTKACDGFWQGVDVYGDPFASQQLTEYHGIIEVKNGGIIQYAQVGIETLPPVPDGGTRHAGGIIKAEDAVFKNNVVGVKVSPFTNGYPGVPDEWPNFSYFRKTLFTINDLFYAVDQQIPVQLYLDDIYNLEITGCTFENSYENAFGNPDYRGKGIVSFNSGYSVRDYKSLDPEVSPVRSEFKGLAYGLHALGNPLLQIIRLDSVIFMDNYRGAYLGLAINPEIVYNDFLVRSKGNYFLDSDTCVGLYLDNYTIGFLVEENNFFSSLNYNQLEERKCVGALINNSGTEPNEVYNNYCSKLLVGISAQGENRSETGEGLCIKCNDFVDCITDVYVAPRYDGNGNPVSGPTIGIAEEQGTENEIGGSDPTLAAGNTFSEDNSEANYYNDPDYCTAVEYVHHNEASTEQKIIPDPKIGITLTQDDDADYSKETACPSNLSAGGSIDESLEKTSLSTEYIAVAAYEDTLGTFTDGGDTEALNTDVQGSFPDEAMEVRQQLLNESPYLSDTVMKSAIDKENVLPNAMVRDILVANPQSAKAPDVINTLDNRFDPMPDYMMGEIMAGLNTTGAKELLEQQLALHKTKRGKSLLKLERFYKNDTLNPAASNDSLVALWQREPYPGAWYKLSFHYLNKSDSAGLFQTLDSIPVNFNLSLEEEQLHDQYEELFEILWTIKADSINPDSTMTQNLLSLSAHKSIPGAYAKNLLIHDSVIIYNEPVYLPDLLKSAPVYPENPYKREKDYILNIFPNPAGDYLIIEYDLSEYIGNLYIKMADIQGKQSKSIKLSNSHTQKVVSTDLLPNGTYLIQLYHDNDVLETTKIVIHK
ncbi:MAG: T9SS type A sorting domain-containing protein [Bacteroidales bacterium]|nr:T9SS type A sorting domain-containing protein [Bacteroidales bacterium]